MRNLRELTPRRHFLIFDYVGPFGIISFVERGQRIWKHYMILFGCFATKAIYLECVEDYTTTGFLAAFRRFISRRSLPSHMYSDNGANFLVLIGKYRQVLSSHPALQVALANANTGIVFSRPRLILEDSEKRVLKVFNFISSELLVFARSLRPNLRCCYVKLRHI